MPDYLDKYKGEWDELSRLVKRCGKSGRRLSAEEIARMDTLYRRTTIHLAQVSTRTRDAELIAYLNDLTASAHSVIYLPPKRRKEWGLWRFVSQGFARVVARTWRFHACSALLMAFGFLWAAVAVSQDPSAPYAILPREEFRQPGATPEQLLNVLRHGRDEGGGAKFMFASLLFSHNLKVGILAMAAGILLGIPTIFLMIYNGMMIGALSWVYQDSGIYSEYWAWILPHGVTELTAIVLCGGIGLHLGWAVVAPGFLTRQESLVRAGREVAQVAIGVAGMLVLAAFAESYVRQSHMSTAGRFWFAGVTAVIWIAYFSRGFLFERLAGEGLKRKAEAG